MNMKNIVALAVASALSLALTSVAAAEKEQTLEPQQAKEQIYGWELMSVQERTEHSEKMRSLATEEERQAYRNEHHKEMQKRAAAQGKTLPEVPAQWGSGQGSGPGGGSGGKSK